MSYETKDNTGTLFINNRKERDTQPDRTGKAKIGGVEYYVNAWEKTGGSGTQYLSFSFKPVEKKEESLDDILG